MHLHRLHRAKEILTVFLEEEFGYIIKKAELHHYLPLSKRWRTALQNKEKSWKPEVHLRQAFERLGPTFVKFGQILSLRPDILPPEYILEFEKMQDSVPPVPFNEVKTVIKKEFGKPAEKVFAHISKKPFASASLAQVHKARLKTGELVAVKVQRPGIEQVIREDIEILYFIAHWMEKRKTLKDFPLASLVDEFRRWTLRELNFSYEALNMKMVRNNFSNSHDVIIPKVFENYSTQCILTTQFITGMSINDTRAIKRNGKNIGALIKKCYQAVVEMILSHGVFHADPHPGNIIIHGNRIAFIDFGIVGRLDEKLRSTVLHLMIAALNNSEKQAADALLELPRDSDYINKERLKRDLRDILDQLHIDKLKDIKISLMLSDILSIINRHRIDVPMDFLLFAKAIITMEGVGLRYSPNFRLLKETAPLIEKELKKQHSPSAIIQKAKEQVETYKSLVEKAPHYLLNTLRHLSEGKLDIEFTPQEFSDLRVELEHSSGNIAIGLMIAAITVSSALIMQVTDEAFLLDIPAISFFGFSLAALLGLWLMKRTLFIRTHSR